MWSDKLIEAMDYAEKSGLDQFGVDMRSWFICYPGRPDYFTHWGGAFKYAASVLGLPIGDYPHSRPPQAELPAEGRPRSTLRIDGSDSSVAEPPGRLRKALPIGVQYVHTSSSNRLRRPDG